MPGQAHVDRVDAVLNQPRVAHGELVRGFEVQQIRDLPDVAPVAVGVVEQVSSHQRLNLTPEDFELFEEAFSDALRAIGDDEYARDALRAMLSPALIYI